jgi:hypothetical protein
MARNFFMMLSPGMPPAGWRDIIGSRDVRNGPGRVSRDSARLAPDFFWEDAPRAAISTAHGQKAKTVPPEEHGFAIRNAWPFALRGTCEDYGSGTRDLIRSSGRVRITAALSVLSAHRYRPVIESLSKSKFAAFLT